jgi:nucleotide-binding universal stress UspA family protein
VADTAHGSPIVVGIDGSAEADRALDWSIGEAKLRGLPVRIVTAWHLPLAVYAGHGTSPPPTVSLEDALREAAESFAEAAARRVRQAVDVAVETRVVEGHATDVLVDEARSADLLVLGSSHHRGVGSVFSSVSVQCTLHASAPTVVVH